VDFSKMETSDWLIAGGGVALFIFSFFSWFGKHVGVAGIVSVSYSQNAWSSPLSLLGILLAIAIAGLLIAMKVFGVELPDLGNFSWDQLFFFGSIGVGVLILLQLLIGASKSGVTLDRKFGVFLGVLAAAAMVAGGFMKFQAANASSSGGDSSAPPTSF